MFWRKIIWKSSLKIKKLRIRDKKWRKWMEKNTDFFENKKLKKSVFFSKSEISKICSTNFVNHFFVLPFFFQPTFFVCRPIFLFVDHFVFIIIIFFLSSIEIVWNFETSRENYFEPSFMSKTYFCGLSMCCHTYPNLSGCWKLRAPNLFCVFFFKFQDSRKITRSTLKF